MTRVASSLLLFMYTISSTRLFFSVQQDSSCDLWFRFISTTVKLCLDLLLFFFVVVVVDISLLKSNHFIRKKWAVVIFTDMNNGTKILAVFYNLYDCKKISDFDNYELVHRQNYFTLLFPELLQIGVVHIIGTCVINVHVHIPRHKNWLFFELLEIYWKSLSGLNFQTQPSNRLIIYKWHHIT